MRILQVGERTGICPKCNSRFAYNEKDLGDLRAWEISYKRAGWCGHQVVVILAKDKEEFADILYNKCLLDENNKNSYVEDMRKARRSSEYGGSGAFWNQNYCTNDKTIDMLIRHCLNKNAANAKKGIYLLPFTQTSFGSDHLWD